MLRWCAYCQQFQGEQPPYDDLRITHGICPSCARTVDRFDTDLRTYTQARTLQQIQSRLSDAGIRHDAQAAASVIDDARTTRVRPVDALMGIVAPMLYEIGVQWERAVVSVEEATRFTAFCEELFRLVSERIAPPSFALTGSESVVLMNAPGNHHVLALRILSLWLSGQDVRSEVVGPDEGLDDIVALVSRVRPRLVLISIALPEQRQAVVDVVTAIAALPQSSRPTVFVGGYAVKMGLIEPIPGAELMADIHELSTGFPTRSLTS